MGVCLNTYTETPNLDGVTHFEPNTTYYSTPAHSGISETS
jgi:hypothetical protein